MKYLIAALCCLFLTGCGDEYITNEAPDCAPCDSLPPPPDDDDEDDIMAWVNGETDEIPEYIQLIKVIWEADKAPIAVMADKLQQLNVRYFPETGTLEAALNVSGFPDNRIALGYGVEIEFTCTLPECRFNSSDVRVIGGDAGVLEYRSFSDPNPEDWANIIKSDGGTFHFNQATPPSSMWTRGNGRAMFRAAGLTAWDETNEDFIPIELNPGYTLIVLHFTVEPGSEGETVRFWTLDMPQDGWLDSDGALGVEVPFQL